MSASTQPYEIVAGVWHDGVYCQPGTAEKPATINLTEAQAKYLLLGSHIRKPKPVDTQAPAPVADIPAKKAKS